MSNHSPPPAAPAVPVAKTVVSSTTSNGTSTYSTSSTTGEPASAAAASVTAVTAKVLTASLKGKADLSVLVTQYKRLRGKTGRLLMTAYTLSGGAPVKESVGEKKENHAVNEKTDKVCTAVEGREGEWLAGLPSQLVIR